jgi:gliding motility-associated lipoprotein GldD
MRFLGIFLVLFFLVVGCQSDTQPKPLAYLSLEYPVAQYVSQKTTVPFSFEANTFARFSEARQSSAKLTYEEMKATLYFNYVPIQNNLDSLLNDAYQLPYKHIIKAEAIPEKRFINQEQRVYGNLFTVVGDAASQFQFFLTDSTKHFLVGSLYFYARPNYDSIYPAVQYLKKDIVHLMETLQWN